MARSRILERVLRIRHLEEEQHRQAVASAMSELRILETALSASATRQRQGRIQVAEGVAADDLVGRHAGLIESRNATRQSAVLARWAAVSTARAEIVRSQWIGKRVERKQAETLVHAAASQSVVEEVRRGQQTADQWYLVRRYQEEVLSSRHDLPQADTIFQPLNDSSEQIPKRLETEA
jgi:flagellar biosynthesis chaperone FliJ